MLRVEHCGTWEPLQKMNVFDMNYKTGQIIHKMCDVITSMFQLNLNFRLRPPNIYRKLGLYIVVFAFPKIELNYVTCLHPSDYFYGILLEREL